MKNIVLIVLLTVTLFGWETTTHRAIDRKAIESSANLSKFIENSKIDTEYKFINEKFEGYGYTYNKYIEKGEEGGISDWNQTFSGDNNIWDAIEAGTILEDALWRYPLHPGDGRFNNHFADPQNNYSGLIFGWGGRVNALRWATGDLYHSLARWNEYSEYEAQRWFEKGFTLDNPNERRKYQAKMLVSVGHIMHMLNDMNVPAHTRNDAHPKGDALEWWARGGESGHESMGFYVEGATVRNPAGIAIPTEPYPFGSLHTVPNKGQLYEYMKKEAEFTGTHFFSGYAKNTFLDQIDTIGTKEYPKNYHEEPCHNSDVPNVEECYIVSDELTSHKKLAIRVKSYFYNALGERIEGIGTQMHGGSMTTFRGDMSVLEDNAYHLLPRAIKNASGFLNYFFRGQMKVEMTYEGLKIINDSNPAFVAEGATVFQEGLFRIYYDDEQGVRHPFDYVLDPSDGTLHNGGSIQYAQIEVGAGSYDEITFDIDRENYRGALSKEEYNRLIQNRITVVYTGKIGSEKGVAVCYATAHPVPLDPPPPTSDPEDPDEDPAPDTSNGCWAGVGPIPEPCEENQVCRNGQLQDGTPCHSCINGINSYGLPCDGNTTEPIEENTTTPIEGNTTEPIEENTTTPIDENTTNPEDENTTNPEDENLTSACPPMKTGVVEVTLTWDKPELDYDLFVDWGEAGEVDVQDAACAMEHFHIKTEKEIVPGKYPVYVVPKDVFDPMWENNSSYPHTITVTIKTPGSSWEAEALIVSEQSITDFGHIADIKVYRTEESETDEGDLDSDTSAPTSAPIMISPVVPPECPPMHITPPVVPPRPVYLLPSIGGGWSYYSGGGFGGGSGSSSGFSSGTGLSTPEPRPVQEDPHCAGDVGCLPVPSDVINNPDTPTTTAPYGTPPLETGGTPQREIQDETEEENPCTGDLSCECIPCEYKIIPYLKQIYFGPLRDANFTIYSIEGYRNNSAIYHGKSTNGDTLYDAGEIKVPPSVLESLEDNRLYVIEAVGGEDIDRDDDFTVDSTPTPNLGKVYAIATGAEIKHVGFKINVLTTVTFEMIKTLISNEADEATIAQKIADVASRVLRYKLYPDKSQHQINNTDMLVWLPTVDKDVLLKSYDPLEEIVQKIYAGESIYEEAYDYVYGSDSSEEDATPLEEPPLIRSFSGEIDENATGGTVVGEIEVLRGEDIVFGELSGKGAEDFEIDTEGKIRLKADAVLDYEKKWLYILKAEASNGHGNSGKVSVYISVKNVLDAPEFIKFEGGLVEENATAGTEVGKIYFDQGAAPIESIELYGESKELFDVDLNGTISLSSSAVLDYEQKYAYGFIVVAKNSYGDSLPVIVYLSVKDVADTPVFTTYEGGYVAENAPAGTVVAQLSFDPGGAAVESVTLEGEGAENFEIDLQGVIRVSQNAVLDYEKYVYYRPIVTCTNSEGSSSRQIFISVRDVKDVPSFLSFEGGNVNENAPIGTVVAEVAFDSGASPVSSMVLSGEDAAYFSIDKQGEITLAQSVDYETKSHYIIYVTAINEMGSSQKLTVHIFVNDVSEEPAVLDNFIVDNVEENLSVGSKIGEIKVLYEGSSPVEFFEISGEGSDSFAVDKNGTVSIAKALDFEKQEVYNLKVKAKNGAGFGNEVNLIVRLVDILEEPAVLDNFIVDNVEENLSVGSKIGEIKVLYEGSSPVEFFELSGSGADKFSVDKNGTVRIAKALDYKEQSIFDLKVKAKNSVGFGDEVDFTVYLKNVVDMHLEIQNVVVNQSNSRAYSADNDHGLHIIDISDTEHPLILSSLDSNGAAKDLLLSKDEQYIYLLDIGEGLKIIDVSDEREPKLLSGVEIAFSSYSNYDMVLSPDGDYVYVLRRKGIEVIDVRDPLSPVIVNTIGFMGVPNSDFPSFFLGMDISLDGEILYITDLSYALQVVDISDKLNPKLLFVDNPGYGHWDRKITVDHGSGIVIVSDEGINSIYDVSDPSDIYKPQDEYGYTISYINHGLAYGVYGGVFTVYDYYHPLKPEKIFGVPVASSDFSITKDGSLGLFVNGEGGLSISSLENIEPPEHHEPVVIDRTITLLESEIEKIAIGESFAKVHMLHTENSAINNVLLESYTNKEGEVVDSSHAYVYFDIDHNGTLSTNEIDALSYNKIGNQALFGVKAENEEGKLSQQAKVTIKIKEDPSWRLQYQRSVIAIENNVSLGEEIANVMLQQSRREILHIGAYVPDDDYCNKGVIEDYVDEWSPSYEESRGYLNTYCNRSAYFDVDQNGSLRVVQVPPGGTYKINIIAIDRFGIRILSDQTIEVSNVYPVLKDAQFSMEENATVGTIVGSVEVESSGASSIEGYRLKESAYFTIDDHGTIRLKQLLDYETKRSHSLEVVAYNRYGESSVAKVVVDVMDIRTVAKLEDFTATVDENVTKGAVIGNVTILDDGDTPIQKIVLYGTGYENFTVDANGIVYVSSNASLDYEQTKEYNLHMRATNLAGESNSASVKIKINNIAEFKPVLKRFEKNIDENISIGTKIGKVEEDIGGDTPIVSYALNDTSTFTIDHEGTLSVARALDYESRTDYTLQAVATNSYGQSAPVDVVIHVQNVPDVLPVIDACPDIFVEENTTHGTVIQTLSFNSGDSPVSRMVLSGEGSSDFSVESNGVLSVSTTADLNATKQKEYYLSVVAANAAGESVAEDIHIVLISEIKIPVAPSELNVSDIGPYHVDISWKDNADNEKGQRVYLYAYTWANDIHCYRNYQLLLVDEVGKDSTSYHKEDLDLMQYYVTVSSYNDVGESAHHPCDTTENKGFVPAYPTFEEVLEHRCGIGKTQFDTAFDQENGNYDGDVVCENLSDYDISTFGVLHSTTGALSLRNSAISYLWGLSSLTEVGGDLAITHNENLEDIKGLSSLSHIGGSFDISNNKKLVEILGLEHITAEVGQKLSIDTAQYLIKPDISSSFCQNSWDIYGSQGEDIEDDTLLVCDDPQNRENAVAQLRYVVEKACRLPNWVFDDSFDEVTGTLRVDRTKYGYLSNIFCNGLHRDYLSRFTIVKHIGSSLYIDGNSKLIHLDGLKNLESVDDTFTIRSNSALVDLQGLEKLQTVGGSFNVTQNSSLETLSGVEHLTHVAGALEIQNNAMLNNIHALNSLTAVDGALHIENNPKIIDISGLQNIAGRDGQELYIDMDQYTIKADATLDFCSVAWDIIDPVGIHYDDLGLVCESANDNTQTAEEELQATLERRCNIAAEDFYANYDSIQGFYTGDIYCTDLTQDELKTFKILNVLEGSLSITNSPALTSLEGLDSLSYLDGALHIHNNQNLTSIGSLSGIYGYEGSVLYIDEDQYEEFDRPLYGSEFCNTVWDIWSSQHGDIVDDMDLVCGF